MANAKLSVLAAQCTANAAAVAGSLAGGVVTADVTALGDFLKTLSLRDDLTMPVMRMAPQALLTTYIQPG